MHNDGELEYYPFRKPLFVNKKEAREKLLQNNHKNESRPKDLNTKTDTYISVHPKAIFFFHWHKIKSVYFEDL